MKNKEEENRIVFDRSKKYRAGLFFPNHYSVAIANLGFHWAYREINSHPLFWGERFTIESHRSLESGINLKDCDIIFLSVSFENDLLNFLKFFQEEEIPLFSREREDFPPVILGGAITFFNPYPFLPFVDAIVPGEGEEKLLHLLDIFAAVGGIRDEFLDSLLKEDWIISTGKKEAERVPIPSFDEAAGAWSVFFSDKGEFGRSFLIEIQRGCTHLCRFCGAGFAYLPPRPLAVENILERVEEWGSGIKKIGLISPSPSDHPQFIKIIKGLIKRGKKVTFSSIRADYEEDDFFNLLSEAGTRTLTLAPETGSEEERKKLNKFITDEQFIFFINRASGAGIKRFKLYFIIGREEGLYEEENILAFLSLLKRRTRGIFLSASFSIFVPKPFTPFQWKRMLPMEMTLSKISFLKRNEQKVRVKFFFENIYDAFIEGFIARSDEDIVEKVFRDRLFFSPGKFYKKNKKIIDELILGSYPRDHFFPWERISFPLRKSFLWSELRLSEKEKVSSPCVVGKCRRCGICGN